MNAIKKLSVFAPLLLATACSSYPVGIGYTDIQMAGTATGNQAGTKKGESCVTAIMGFVAQGDASIEAARRAGGITQITSVDHSIRSYVLGAYTTYCTIVWGR